MSTDTKDDDYENLNDKLSVLFQNVNKLASNVEQVSEINTATIHLSTLLNNIVKNSRKYDLTERGE